MNSNIENLIEKHVICKSNNNFEDRLTVGNTYISLYDYMFNTYCILKDDKNGYKQLFSKNLFDEIC